MKADSKKQLITSQLGSILQKAWLFERKLLMKVLTDLAFQINENFQSYSIIISQ